MEVVAAAYQIYLGPPSPAEPGEAGLAGGKVGAWAWAAQDRPDLWNPGPQLSREAVTWRRQALPGLG